MLARKYWLHLKNTFTGAWTLDAHESKLQCRIEAATSIIAPLLVLCATTEVSYQYWRRSDEYFLLVAVISVAVVAFSLGTLLFACSSLEAHLERRSAAQTKQSQQLLRGSPMLVFAAFLFSAGAAFTITEAIDYFFGSIGFLHKGERKGFDSPWGDILLAASAICMLVEEFVLLTMYDSVKAEAMRVRKFLRSDDLRKLVDEAGASVTKIETALDQATRHGADLEKYSNEAHVLLETTKKWQSDARQKFKKLRTAMIVITFTMVVIWVWAGVVFYHTLVQLQDR